MQAALGADSSNRGFGFRRQSGSSAKRQEPIEQTLPALRKLVAQLLKVQAVGGKIERPIFVFRFPLQRALPASVQGFHAGDLHACLTGRDLDAGCRDDYRFIHGAAGQAQVMNVELAVNESSMWLQRT